MKSFPKTVNNRDDLNNCRSEFPRKTKEFLQDILDFKDLWIMTGKLADGDAGITDAAHKVEEVKDMETGVVTERYQYELMEDPSENGPIKRFGFADGAEMRAYMEAIEY